MWHEYINARDVPQVLDVLARRREAARVVAGATDLILELERGVRRGVQTLIDITRVPALNEIFLDAAGRVHLGPLVTHNQCVASDLIRRHGFPLARAAWEVGAPQIRNRGTIAGNVITASPANDTITPLMALDAEVTLRSTRGERVVPLSGFYTGVRRTVMQPDEMLIDIAFTALQAADRGTFVKLALRRAQAISVANAAVIVKQRDGTVETAAIALGSVAPTIVRAAEAEAYLQGRKLDDETVQHAARLSQRAAQPIDDIRGSAAYRLEMVRVCTRRALDQIRNGEETLDLPDAPVLLATPAVSPARPIQGNAFPGDTISVRINGRPHTFRTGYDKTLLRLLREDAGLIGTKEGCAEGECGACTVFLDGMAVMACLVPAARADGADIVTVEGLTQPAVENAAPRLNAVQQAFVETGAVQCGYCTPGFLMSATKLLAERPSPSRSDIETALTGNLCRCTGYYKIVQAIELAALRLQSGIGAREDALRV